MQGLPPSASTSRFVCGIAKAAAFAGERGTLPGRQVIPENPFLTLLLRNCKGQPPFAGERGVSENPFLTLCMWDCKGRLPFAGERGVPENLFCSLCMRDCKGQPPFAGERGVPENPLFLFLFAAAGGQRRRIQRSRRGRVRRNNILMHYLTLANCQRMLSALRMSRSRMLRRIR